MANEITILKNYCLNNDKVKQEFEMILGNRTGAFLNSIINLATQSDQLARCTPESIMSAAKRSATLDLPIDRSLGFAAIVPYGKEAQFQLQYKGIIQLAIRSGQYKTIDAMEIYADELESYSRIENEIRFTPDIQHKQRDSGLEKDIVGYYARFELLNGYKCQLYVPKKKALDHAKKYSKSYNRDLAKNEKKSIWSTNLTAMGIKTALKMLLTYGILSVDMQDAIIADNQSLDNVINDTTNTIKGKAGSVTIDVEPTKGKETKTNDIDDEFVL